MNIKDVKEVNQIKLNGVIEKLQSELESLQSTIEENLKIIQNYKDGKSEYLSINTCGIIQSSAYTIDILCGRFGELKEMEKTLNGTSDLL